MSKDKSVHGLNKLPDSVIISQLRQELGKSNSYIDELKERIELNIPRRVKNAHLNQLNCIITNLEKSLDKYRRRIRITDGNDSDFNHWCSYNGIDIDNKKELLSIIKGL
jgi:hypothetical protein